VHSQNIRYQVESISESCSHTQIATDTPPIGLMDYRNIAHQLSSKLKFTLYFWLLFAWLLQISSLAAFTHEADWKLETLQNTSQEWWKTLRIKTVPGVVYHLQKSNDLESGNWVNIETLHGTGAEWICPIMRGTSTTTPTPASLVLPAFPIHPLSQISLTMEKSTSGETLISWKSLDDQTPRRQILSDIILSPIWEGFESLYLNPHGNYYFAISPRLGSTVNFSASSSATGPLDTAMILAFKAALPSITSNIENDVTDTPTFASPPATSGSREFYRFSADWSLNSDGDSRFDWQELVLDHNNPHATDSDGDGSPDQAAPSSEINPGDFPLPGDVDEPTPQAMIQQIQLGAYRTELFSSSIPNSGTNIDSGTIATGDSGIFNGASTFSAFQSQVQQLNLQSYGINFNPSCNSTDVQKISMSHLGSSSGANGSHSTRFFSAHCLFRLFLDAPAPPGGYKIPLHFARISESYNPETSKHTLIGIESREIILEVAENQTLGIPFEFQMEADMPVNTTVTYVPGVVFAEGLNFNADLVTGEDRSDGVCLSAAGKLQAILTGGMESIEGSELSWQSRRLMGSGSFGSWTTMIPSFIDGEEEVDDQERRDIISNVEPGVFQLRAVCAFPNGGDVVFPYVRMRDSRSIKNGDQEPLANDILKAGALDCFGVAENELSLKIWKKAKSFLGSTRYAFNQEVETDFDNFFSPSLKSRNKCNIFVTHVAKSVGATTPYFYLHGISPHAPIARDDWYSNPGEHIKLEEYGWKYGDSHTDVAPGRVIVSFGVDRPSGHVCILDYDGSWIGAGSKTVNKFINLQNLAREYKPFTIRQR
jgi:hypothetical protein